MIKKKATPYSAEEDSTLLKMRAAGATMKAIAVAMGRPISSTGNRLRHLLGLPKCSSALRPHVRRILQQNEEWRHQVQLERQQNEELKSQRQLDLEDQTRMFKQAKSLAGVCKCLGGCGQTFKSPDRMRIRICGKCRKRTEYLMHDNGEFSLRL